MADTLSVELNDPTGQKTIKIYHAGEQAVVSRLFANTPRTLPKL